MVHAEFSTRVDNLFIFRSIKLALSLSPLRHSSMQVGICASLWCILVIYTTGAATERFLKDWRRAHVTVVVRDSRMRENNPIIGTAVIKVS